MNSPQIITDIERKVKDALDVWAEWMSRDDEKLGYPSHSLVVLSGGGAWGNYIEDQEIELDRKTAEAVDALYDSLTHSQQIAIDHFHLAAVWKSNRTDIADDYAKAIARIGSGLRDRGLI